MLQRLKANQNELLVPRTTDNCSLVIGLFLNLCDKSFEPLVIWLFQRHLNEQLTFNDAFIFVLFNSPKQENAFSGKYMEKKCFQQRKIGNKTKIHCSCKVSVSLHKVPVSLNKASPLDYKLVVLSHYFKRNLCFSTQSTTISQINTRTLGLAVFLTARF